MKLTKNFILEEFTKSGKDIVVPTKEQIYCVQVLCENILQPIRDTFGLIKINSGLRDKAIYEKLIKNNYPASKTSDHFGWSDVNPRGTGAADFFVVGYDSKDLYTWCIKNLMPKIGQIIYYPDSHFVHISNRFNLIFIMPDSRDESTRKMIHVNNSFIPYVE